MKNNLPAAPHIASRILNNKVKGIHFKHLEKLCLLLNCTPNELLVWQAPDKSAFHLSHPLQKLRSKKTRGVVTQKLKSMTPEQLARVREFIDQLPGTEASPKIAG